MRLLLRWGSAAPVPLFVVEAHLFRPLTPARVCVCVLRRRRDAPERGLDIERVAVYACGGAPR